MRSISHVCGMMKSGVRNIPEKAVDPHQPDVKTDETQCGPERAEWPVGLDAEMSLKHGSSGGKVESARHSRRRFVT